MSQMTQPTVSKKLKENRFLSISLRLQGVNGRMDGRKSLVILQSEKCIWPRYDLDL